MQECIFRPAITLNRILLPQKDSQGKIISIYSEHIQRQGTMHSPREFIIIPRLSQAQWIWNANELVRIKKSLWSETSPNLLQDKRYTAMAYTPSLSLPESQRYFYIYSPILGHLHPPTRTKRYPLSWNGNSASSWCCLTPPDREVLSWGRRRAGLQDDRLPSLAINYSAAALALRHGWSLCRQGFLSSQALCSLQRASFACKTQRVPVKKDAAAPLWLWS